MMWLATVALGLVTGAASTVIPRQTSGNVTTGGSDPRNQCPGYRVVDAVSSPASLYARLELAGEPCDVYGDDLRDLVLKVSFENENRLHVVIEDAEEMVYQIPESVLPVPEAEEMASKSSLKFNFEAEPFSFSVTRAETGEVLFDTSAAGLIFESQYVRLRTHLPEDPNIYGLPEHADPLRLDSTDYIRTFWNRDAFGTGDNENLYSSHPIYIEHRASGTHGVFLRNSNGMDIMFNKTASGDQYLEYNILGGVLDFSFFAGPSPAEVSKQYAEVIGLPAMFPYWALGFNQCRYGYRDAFNVAEMIYNYSKAEIPLEIAWIDIDYMDRRLVFTNDPDRFPLPMFREIVDHLHDNNQKFTVMVDPAVGYLDNAPYDRGMEADIFLKNPDGSLFKGVVWPGVTVFPDWFHPNIEEYWNREFEMFFNPETGIDIDQCWIDMNEPSSFGCEFQCDPEQVVAESDIFPPEPPPVRSPPRPLPGWSCLFQPEGTECEENTKRSVGQTAVKSIEGFTKRQDSANSTGPIQGKHMGLPGRDLLYPKYAIHNEWAYETSYNADKGGLSNFTVPTNVRHANGLAEYDVHNLYGHMMSAATRTAMLNRRPGLRPSIITRSTFAGSGKHVAKWTGDNVSSWSHYLLHIRSILGFAITQNPFVGPDVCGFVGNTTEQLCARWAMLGAFTPFYRNHNSADSSSQEFYLWESVTQAARKAIDIRYRLLDYMYTALWQQTEDGTPSLNPMFYLYPEDTKTWGIDTQFFYGDALMIAPVTEENATSVEVYFPDDIFYDWYTGEKIVGEGKGVNVTDQSLTDIPLYVSGGHILPLRVKSAMTTADVRKENFELLVALGKDGTAKGMLYLDDGESLEPEGTTEVHFEYSNGALSAKGTYGYQTDLKVVKVIVLGGDIPLGESPDESRSQPGGKKEVEVDQTLSGDFSVTL